LVPGYPYYVAVRATNGQGGVSATGVSIPLRYDPTPPVFATGAALTMPLTLYQVLPATAAATYAACTVPQPSLPGTPLVALTLTPPAIAGAWAGALTTASAATGATPQVQLTRPDASDPESGVEAYYYDVSTQPGDTIYAPAWRSTSARSSSVTVSGAPLDFQNQFYVTLVAKNTAGLLSRVLSYGPFRIADPTPPILPVICAGDGAVAGQLAVQITTRATDPETQVAGYQYRVRTAQGALVRGWPSGTTTDWPGSVGAAAVATATLADGQSYLVDVRAINGQGEVSGFVTSGPVLYDLSPPPMPTASVTVTSGVPSLAVNATPDPQSGLAAVQWAVGTSQTSADVQPWVSSAVPAAGGAITLPFATALPTSTTLWLQVRLVNGTSLVSTIYSASFTVPATPKLGLPVTLPATRLP
ncbi:MAG TPA: hypothetical protein VMD31_03045, partial [Opitutaceae bacterium]|nr:hypothetical protein [Opitutaceae bacterium]